MTTSCPGMAPSGADAATQGAGGGDAVRGKAGREEACHGAESTGDGGATRYRERGRWPSSVPKFDGEGSDGVGGCPPRSPNSMGKAAAVPVRAF